jgi:DNA-directed RNA polymerase subunit beta'
MRVNVKKEGNSLQLVPFMESQITGKNGISSGEIKEPGLAVRGKDLRPEKDGLFDEKITGGMDGSRWSHISLAEPLPNPLFEDAIRKLTGLGKVEYRDIVSGKKKINGKTGGRAIEDLLKDIDVAKERKATRKAISKVRGERRSVLHKKLRILKALDEQGLDPTVYVMKSVPVMPPVFRPMVVKENGNISSNDLNGLYKDVGAVNDLLKKNKQAGIPDDHLTEMRMELYDGLKALTGTGGSLTRRGEYKGILDIISGKTRKSSTGAAVRGTAKEGFFQKRVMKRRQDFSGRSTIVPEPRMGLDEIGLPEKMAWTMYQPFIERELIRSGYKPFDAFDTVKKKEAPAERALQKVVKERPILMKRDPALHMFNVMAFKPRLVKGKAIEIHPLVTSAYNADFDGDTMSVYVPITSKASKEAEGMYPSNNLFNPTTGAIQYTPGHEALLGLYLASTPGKRTKHRFATAKDAVSAHKRGKIKYTDVIRVGGKETTVGRLEIESVLPASMRETGKKTVSKMHLYDKKGTKKILTRIAKDHTNLYGEVANKFKDIGNNYSTNLGYSVGLSDFKVINKTARDRLIAGAQKEAERIRKGSGSSKNKEKKIINLYAGVDDQLDKLNTFHLKKFPTNISRMVDSGARGNFTQLKQIVSSPILVKDGKDRVVPYIIPKSYSEGMDVASYWTTMHGARKGTVQKVQGVRDPGYISKQVMNSSMSQLVTEKDCGTTKGIYLSLNSPDILDRKLATNTKFGSRKYTRNVTIDTRTLSAAKKAGRKRILVRSPLRCEASHGVCQSCIGNRASGASWDIGTNIGVIAGQSIGEPSTQLSMNAFHEGGLAKGRGAKSQGTFERLGQTLRLPVDLPNRAPLALSTGTVQRVEIAAQGGHNIYIGGKSHYIPASQERWVKKGQKVRKGEPLSNGVVDPRGLLALRGLQDVQDHLTGEIHGVLSTAAPVRRRNVEVVVKAMTDITRVEDPGNHPDWIPGDMRRYSAVRSWNSKSKGKPVEHTPVLKGVNVLPLSVQEDWVARLGYNNLGRTLIEAAREGWKSNIHGFHPIPALAYAKEFGKKVSVKDWKGQY